MASRRPSFLDNKVVTTRGLCPFEDAPMARPIGDKIEKRFNDYFHFVNWYRKTLETVGLLDWAS